MIALSGGCGYWLNVFNPWLTLYHFLLHQASATSVNIYFRLPSSIWTSSQKWPQCQLMRMKIHLSNLALYIGCLLPHAPVGKSQNMQYEAWGFFSTCNNFWFLWSFSKSPTDSGYEKEFLCKLSLAYGHLDPSFSLLLLPPPLLSPTHHTILAVQLHTSSCFITIVMRYLRHLSSPNETYSQTINPSTMFLGACSF